MKTSFLYLSAAACLLVAEFTAAQSYPTRPMRFIVPFSAGSASDLLARVIGPKLTEAWGQQVIVESRPSAGGTIAGGIVATINFAFLPVLMATPLVKSGRLSAVGLTTKSRLALLPDVPTIDEAALPGFEYDGWFGVFAPSRTPRTVIDKLSGEIGRILRMKEVSERIDATGAIAKPSTPAEFDKLVRDEIVKRRKVFTAAGTKVQ